MAIKAAKRAPPGCWTCKERKVACDRQVPTCGTCIKSKRQCGGFGMRLSWPQQQDFKRAMVYDPAGAIGSYESCSQDVLYINASSRDIHLHEAATFVGWERSRTQTLDELMPCLEEPWTTSPAKPSEEDLLQYFKSTAINVLAMLDSDRQRLCRILMRFASSDESLASKAVLSSMLAVSSLLRDGEKTYTAQYKLDALDALMLSTKRSEYASAEGGIKHIAAGLLLCTFEIQQTSGESSQWIGHVCAIQGIIRSLEKIPERAGCDMSVILGWALYYDVLSRFSIRHWRTPAVERIAIELGFDAKRDNTCALQYLLARSSYTTASPDIAIHAHPVLGMLSEVCTTSINTSEARYHAEYYQEYLIGLRARLEQLSTNTEQEPSSLEPADSVVLELFRLTALIYLERASRNFSGQSQQIEAWTTRAFEILSTLQTCRWSFPLFVLACEAKFDDQRVIVLGLLEQTAKELRLSHLQMVRKLIQTAWVQDDLEVNGPIEYVGKLNLVMSSSRIFPGFV